MHYARSEKDIINEQKCVLFIENVRKPSLKQGYLTIARRE